MGVMQLIAFIEETFDCNVPQADITIFNFRTVAAIALYLEKRNISSDSATQATSVGSHTS